MPRSKRASNRSTMDDDIDESSGSDFDDDEDPDKIQVPGGGKDLAAAAGILESRESRENKLKQEAEKISMKHSPLMSMPPANSKFPHPGFPPGFDMMRNPAMGGPPSSYGGMNSMTAMASMLSSLGGPLNMGAMFPPASGFNAAQLLQQKLYPVKAAAADEPPSIGVCH